MTDLNSNFYYVYMSLSNNTTKSGRVMAGFTPLSWVENSIPNDGYAPKDDDQQSMVSVVEEVLSCEESVLKNKSSSYKRLRSYIRMGIYPLLRPNAWKVLSGGSRVLELTQNLFTDIQDDLGEFICCLI